MSDETYGKGDVIGGKFEVHATLGKGGFGVVYLVYDRELEELVALKTFRNEGLLDTEARDAFKKESLLWVNLEEHPHILAARWVSEASGRLFVSMDYVAPDTQGRVTLHDHLVSALGPMNVNQVLGWGIQFCRGIEHAHAHGLACHRDIKPGNILIAQDWILKIADFGLAAAAAKMLGKSNPHADSLATGATVGRYGFSVIPTAEGIRCGTPGYMAPEVYRCEPADARSDLYSFGLVLWQMAAGSKLPPFAGSWQMDIETYLLEIYRRQMAGRFPQVPDPFEKVVARCLAPEPSQRYSGFEELRATLESLWETRTGTIFPVLAAEERMAAFWSNKGAALDALGRHPEAVRCFAKALTIDAQDAGAWINKGVAHDHLGEHEQAIKCYVHALEVEPRHGYVWNNLGNAHDALDRHDEAISCYDVALAADPQDAGAWSNKGNALNALGRHEEAVVCLDEALAIDSRLAHAWNNKAMALRALGLREKAIECYDKALAIDPHYSATWRNKGLAFQEVGRQEDALVCFGKALTIEPQDGKAWFNKGDSFSKLGRHKEALECFENSLAIEPGNIATWYSKAVSENSDGRTTSAIASLRRFIELVPPAESKVIEPIQELIRKLEMKGNLIV